MLSWLKKLTTPSTPENSELDLKNLGNQCFAAGKLEDAADYYRQAIKLKPDYADAYSNLGAVYETQGKIAEAVTYYRSAVAYNSQLVSALQNLGLALRKLEQGQASEEIFKRIIAIDPAHILALQNLSWLLVERGDASELEDILKRLIELKPDDVDAHNSLAVFYKQSGRVREAESWYRKAIVLAPNHNGLHHNLGNLLIDEKRFSEAEASYRNAIALRPDHAQTHNNLSYLLLMTGRLSEGWREHEYRWEGGTKFVPRPSIAAPQWMGQTPAPEDSLLIIPEQGLGDMIQFSRYIPLAAERFGGKVKVLMLRELQAIFSHSFPSVEVLHTVSFEQPGCQWYCPIESLPLAFDTVLESIPCQVPYLLAEHTRVEYWKAKVRALGLPDATRKIGIVWKTGLGMKNAPLRSLNLQQLSPLLDLDSCCWVSLQKSQDPDALPWVSSGKLIDWSQELNDFQDTAALVMNLDLVISVDTSVVHLAGALGRPTWLFNRYASEWRWMHAREDSPWYPTMRIFNQKTEGDWDEVVGRMREVLLEPSTTPKTQSTV